MTQTMSMQKVLIVFFIVFFVIMILVFPFKTRAMVHINFFELKCFYSAKIWLLKILCGMVNFDNDKINEMLELGYNDVMNNKEKIMEFINK